MNRGAIFTEGMRHRPVLIRNWDMSLPLFVGCLLNPSKANHERDDPTTSFMINIAKREGCGRYMAVNVHDYVATDPNGMKNILDPVSPDNDKYIIEAIRMAHVLVVTWGRDGNFIGRADHVMDILTTLYHKEIYCFGINNDGSPRFPRALRKDVQLIRYQHQL